MTDLERRERIRALCLQDGEYCASKARYDEAHRKFTAFTEKLPRKLRDFLWAVPDHGYLMHHRMLHVICENMRFPDEE